MSDTDLNWMRQAITLAKQGEGLVEPNPMVGCVIVKAGEVIGTGYHQQFGGPHAEVHAIEDAKRNGHSVEGSTVYVTLEPCSHQGKTPPCANALIESKVAKVWVGAVDPNPQVCRNGIGRLRDAGIEVHEVALAEAFEIIAPFRKVIETGMPYVIAKWAMSLDGKIATEQGDSKWISNPESRKIVHQIRGRVDGVLVGRGTVQADDPMLNARPPGPRIPARIVMDSKASISLESQLIQSTELGPIIVVCSDQASSEKQKQLVDHGAELITIESQSNGGFAKEMLQRLGERKMTNLLVEGGSKIHGAFFESDLVDEIHVFISPQIVGTGKSPVEGLNIDLIQQSKRFSKPTLSLVDGDVYVTTRRKI